MDIYEICMDKALDVFNIISDVEKIDVTLRRDVMLTSLVVSFYLLLKMSLDEQYHERAADFFCEEIKNMVKMNKKK